MIPGRRRGRPLDVDGDGIPQHLARQRHDGGGSVAEKSSVCRSGAGASGSGGYRAGSPCRASGRPRPGRGPRARPAARRGSGSGPAAGPGSRPARRRRAGTPAPGAPCRRRRRRRRPRCRLSRASCRRWSSICAASSRVGVMTSARVAPRGVPARRCRIGSRKAAVLPLPVTAQASTSRPAMAGGMASRWIGVGVDEAQSRRPRAGARGED